MRIVAPFIHSFNFTDFITFSSVPCTIYNGYIRIWLCVWTCIWCTSLYKIYGAMHAKWFGSMCFHSRNIYLTKASSYGVKHACPIHAKIVFDNAKNTTKFIREIRSFCILVHWAGVWTIYEMHSGSTLTVIIRVSEAKWILYWLFVSWLYDLAF